MIGDMLKGEPNAVAEQTRSDPAVDLVTRFLRAMEDRDLPRAAAMTAADFVMIFPGGRHYRTLKDLVAASSGRYRSIAKTFERFDAMSDGANTVVYCFGTLNGEWPDGTRFAGIRYIDRFTVRDGKLQDQRVWNDMGEVLAHRSAADR